MYEDQLDQEGRINPVAVKSSIMDKMVVQAQRGDLLVCEAHPDHDYPGFTLYWDARQIAVIEFDGQDAATPRILVWTDDKEDFTLEIAINSSAARDLSEEESR